MVITRFAPSPTGSLHIGSVRTILFNWLYAKHCNGKFLLRIEDTDVERSKLEYVQEICDTLNNLGFHWDDEIVFQLKNIKRHQEVAHNLLNEGKAYRCYCTQEELANMRELATKEGQTPRYERKCRDLKEILDKPFTVRLKCPTEGRTEFVDLIQGVCSIDNEHLDDMILLRSDGTPTYMLAVVVDDHDMKITHVIRASEHLNNTYRQKQIYEAAGWNTPEFAHVSLIHGEDGAKLSKRHGATSLNEYLKQGFLKEAILNYLLMLGWSNKDPDKIEEEIISIEDCIKVFDIRNVRSSPARFSLHKLLSMNAIYIRNKTNAELLSDLKKFMDQNKHDKKYDEQYDAASWARIEKGMSELKVRIRTLAQLEAMAKIYGNAGDYFGALNTENKNFLQILIEDAENEPWDIQENITEETTKAWLNERIIKHNKALKEIAQDLRFALTKEKVAPSIFELMRVLGSKIFAQRIKNAIS